MRKIMEEVFVLSAVRTPIGRYGGGLASVPPCGLAAKVVREAVVRSGAEPGQVGHAVFGNVIHTEVRDMYLARVAALNGGLEDGTPALTLNRLCGSGLQAIVSASQSIMLGDCEVAVAGGAESMSRAPYWLPGLRWGQRMNDVVTVDPMVGALTDPFDACHMGVTAENVAADFGVSGPTRTPWPLRAIAGPQPRPRRDISPGRSCRSRCRARRALRSSTPTSTSGPLSASTTWPGSAPPSRPTAR
jgi:acetyl-CoA C-acetyltransferase